MAPIRPSSCALAAVHGCGAIRSVAVRRVALILGSVATVSVSLLLAAAPAGAIVTPVSTGGGTTTVGLQPRTEELGEGKPGTFANESGDVVLHGTSVYAIYWDPQNLFHHEWLTHIDSFFQRMGASSGALGANFAALGQYRDRSNTGAVYQTVFKASYSDTSKYPSGECTDPNTSYTKKPIVCLTDAQLREQLKSFIAGHGLPKGMNSVFYVLTPPGVAVCVDAAATRCSDYKVSGPEEAKEERKSVSYEKSFCSYHSDISPTNEVTGDENTILYAAIPWSVGTAGDEALKSSHRVYAEAFDCQDGGWNPEGHEETKEKEKEVTKSEKEAFESATAEEKAKILRRRQLEQPHEQEPNQEGKGESGDYAPGLADLIINQIAEEQANTVTDPMLNAWQDSERREVTDDCRDYFSATAGESVLGGAVAADEHTEAGTVFNTQLSSPELGPDSDDLNNVLSLGQASGSCVGGVGLFPRFTAPNPVNANEIVGFDGMESTVGILEGEAFGASGPPSKTYATFTWNFGDGTELVKGFAPGAPLCEAPWLSPCAASVFHSYQYGGKYQVTLKVTDVAGNISEVHHMVTVEGSPPPSGASSATSPATATASAGSSGAGGSSSTAPSKPVPSPVATAAVLSRSLRSVLSRGLLVRYTVNEQVAGHFEVLLNASLAHHLGISGPTASGLAAGSPASIVIGRAILVTTKGGRNTVKIDFSKRTDARLAKLHKVSLTLRLIVRNASSRSPASTTVLSVLTLSH